jgi:hypothetical protein
MKTHLLTIMIFLIVILSLCGCSPRTEPVGQLSQPSLPTQKPAPGAQPRARIHIDLNSYEVSYSKHVTGSLDGSPYETSTRIVRSIITQPAAQDFIIESQGPGEVSFYHRYIHHHSGHYYQTAAGRECRGALDGDPQSVIIDPAAMLPVVGGVQPDRTDTVNGIQAAHYRIDGVSLGLAPERGTASGELWIAEPGGYVVKYDLEILPPPAPTGVGLEAHQTIHYEIRRANQVTGIGLPAECVPILTGIPLLPDAAGVQHRSAYVSYITRIEPSGVVDFYNRELAALGWQMDAPPEDEPGQPRYYKDKTSLDIVLDPEEGGWRVTILFTDPKYMAVIPAGDPAQVEAGGEDTSEEFDSAPETPDDYAAFGLPEDVPVYPKASDLQGFMDMGVMFDTSDSARTVSDFYTEELEKRGWTALPGGQAPGSPLMWRKGALTLMVTIEEEGGETLVSIMAVNP